MSAVIGAFVRYALTFVYFAVVAGAGIFAGRALHEKKMRDKMNEENATSKE